MRFLYGFAFFFSFITLSHSQDFIWNHLNRQLTGVYTSNIQTRVDSQNAVYTGGATDGYFDADDSEATYGVGDGPNSYSNGMFLTKLDADKNHQWSLYWNFHPFNSHLTQIRITPDDRIFVLVNLAAHSNGYTYDMDPSAGEALIQVSTALSSSYVIELTSQGEFVNVQSFMGYSFLDMSVSATGDFYFLNKVRNTDVNHPEVYRVDVLKYAPNWDLQWSRAMYADRYEHYGMELDSQHQVVLLNTYSFSLDWGNEELFVNEVANPQRYSILKISNQGDLLWAHKLHYAVDNVGSWNQRFLVIDPEDTIYFNTHYNVPETITIGNQTIELPFSHSIETVLFKLNAQGVHQWNFPIIGYTQQHIHGIQVLATGELWLRVIALGDTELWTTHQSLFDEPIVPFTYTGMLVRLTAQGEVVAKKPIFPNGSTFLLDHADNLLVIGSIKTVDYLNVNTPVDFDPHPDTAYWVESPTSSAFVCKLGNCTTDAPIVPAVQEFCSSAAPTIAQLLPQHSSYRWYASMEASEPLDSSTPLQPLTTYFVSHVQVHCPESDRAAVQVLLWDDIPVPNVPPLALCANTSYTLADLPVEGTALQWYADATAATVLPLTTALVPDHTYFVGSRVNDCESERVEVVVDWIITPIPEHTNPAILCPTTYQTLADLTIMGENVSWYADAATTVTLATTTPLVDGTTYFYAQTINGCESLRSAFTVQLQSLELPEVAPIQRFCLQSQPSVADLVPQGEQWQWFANMDSATPLAPDAALVNGQAYFFGVQNGECSSLERQLVQVELVDAPNVTSTEHWVCSDAQTTVYVNLLDQLLEQIAPAPDLDFAFYYTEWGAWQADETALLTQADNWAAHTTRLFVRISNALECIQVVAMDWQVYANPVLELAPQLQLCDGQALQVLLDAGYASYQWSTGATTRGISITNPGIYYVTVSQVHGDLSCTTTAELEVIASGAPQAIQLTTSDFSGTNNSLYVEAIGLGEYEYSLDGIHYQTEPWFTQLAGGAYTVYVRDQKGCGERIAETYILTFPAFFTPNGDGYNDKWYIAGAETMEGFYVRIFDRYGKLLTVLNGSERWDGTFNGKPLPASDYWFVIERANGPTVRGHFTLKR